MNRIPVTVLARGEAAWSMRHMVDTHWTEQRSEDQLDYLE